jgi:quercetin dioxygenase-like cupin family protein
MRIDIFVGLVATVGVVTALFPGSLCANDVKKSGAKVTSLMQKALPDYPGKEGVVARVEFPPGHVDGAHRHDAHVFVYVLEGTVEMQVEGGKPVMLNAGDTFYENPQDVHPIGRNVSNTKSAKFIVFFVKNQNAPLALPPTRK